MKTFLKRISLFLIVLILLLVTLDTTVPYFYGDSLFAKKVNYFQNHSKNINTVIFGSSRLYRHLKPHLLDSLLINENISSFNFATPATFHPESYYLYENFINNVNQNSIKVAILELQELQEISGDNYRATKGNYWNNLESLRYCYDYIGNTHYSYEEKNQLRKQYTLSFLYRFIDFNKMKYFLNIFRPTKINLGKDKGFYSLEQNMIDKGHINNFRKRHEEFKQDTSVISKRIKAASQLFSSSQDSSANLNVAHLNRLKKLIKKSSDKGIHLILVIPPRLEDYSELASIYNKLPKNNVIELASYKDFQPLYFAQNSFDIGHLNTKGASIFTKFLAREIEKRI